MNLRAHIIDLLLLALVCALVYYFLPLHAGSIVPGYDHYCFYPLQSFRDWWLCRLPFSLGDVIYCVAAIALLVTVVRWVAYLFTIRYSGPALGISIIRTIKAVLYAYLLLIIGWGANYYKPSLPQYWSLLPAHSETPATDTAGRRKLAMAHLLSLNEFLVTRLNACAPFYQSIPLDEVNKRAAQYYRTYTNTKLQDHGLYIKPSLFGRFMERLGVEGYYNPFTGEGQVNHTLPSFTFPFIICHEMAHQAGIGSEEDANLLAYALGTTCPNSTFRYSCYLDLWQYANIRLYHRDSVAALRYEARLNKLTIAHLDTLEQVSRKYHNPYARYSNELYDSYLKMQDQKDGIRSYGNVVSSAWLLEQKRAKGMKGVLDIP